MKSSCIDEIIFEIKNLCYLDATKFVAQCFIFKKISKNQEKEIEIKN